MSEREEPGWGSLPGRGGDRFDAVERLRRKLEELKKAEAGSAEGGDAGTNLTRMPRRPRRMSEESGKQPDRPWQPLGGSVYDPAPTRPVLRSELQRETGWWPVDPNAAGHPEPQHDSAGPAQDASVIDLGAVRRQRSGDSSPATGGMRPVARPRRIGSTGEKSEHEAGRDGTPE
ncbi:hypothetical protein GPX89_35380 [Nocardia sp. ET3-3]|uniref:Uncharacterized protein n=1 Tax=Nocardia terrae TaxID=2675851 RepID=A0A7K1V776_9NOCA|nr:hypothetical protein [Nocardia terrae]MVU82500.1 hypothetical protein [Nocardia terrae]